MVPIVATADKALGQDVLYPASNELHARDFDRHPLRFFTRRAIDTPRHEFDDSVFVGDDPPIRDRSAGDITPDIVENVFRTGINRRRRLDKHAVTIGCHTIQPGLQDPVAKQQAFHSGKLELAAAIQPHDAVDHELAKPLTQFDLIAGVTGPAIGFGEPEVGGVQVDPLTAICQRQTSRRNENMGMHVKSQPLVPGVQHQRGARLHAEPADELPDRFPGPCGQNTQPNRKAGNYLL